MKSSLYNEVKKRSSITEQAKEIQKQREYIKTHLDLLGLKYDAIVVTNIREQLNSGYTALDVAVAYGKIYRSKHECVELYRRNHK